MAAAIEVRVGGRGVASAEELRMDPATQAKCDLCEKDLDAVVSVGRAGGPAVFACAECIRERLGAMSIARWRLKDDHKTPWGKISG
jgi:hypothetical protein